MAFGGRMHVSLLASQEGMSCAGNPQPTPGLRRPVTRSRFPFGAFALRACYLYGNLPSAGVAIQRLGRRAERR